MLSKEQILEEFHDLMRLKYFAKTIGEKASLEVAIRMMRERYEFL